ncbi:hypothetical protein HMPREF9154_0207 [Arachnia propionica F0230a]|nr:hypothetical protein HMPREF9154_0207 [Arachnia propionica F0230a]
MIALPGLDELPGMILAPSKPRISTRHSPSSRQMNQIWKGKSLSS